MEKNIKSILVPTGILFLIGLFFVSARFLLGGSLDVNYGYNLLAGEIPHYYQKLFNVGRLINWIFLVFISFNFMWYGLLAIWKDKFLFKSTAFVPVLIVVQLFLASRVERIIFIAFPIVIPAFLILFRSLTQNEEIVPSSVEKIKILANLPSSINIYIEKIFQWINRNSASTFLLLFIFSLIPQSFFLLRQFYGF